MRDKLRQPLRIGDIVITEMGFMAIIYGFTKQYAKLSMPFFSRDSQRLLNDVTSTQ